MVGGRRAGKSTLLACVLKALRDNEKTSKYFNCDDVSDYQGSQAPSLNDKIYEISRFVEKKRPAGASAEFVVDMSPTSGMSTYSIDMNINGGKASLTLDFIDVNGEYYEQNASKVQQEIEKNEIDIYLIVLDTPCMMELSSPANENYNRINEITRFMKDIEPRDENDDKLVLICPVKGETWLQQGQSTLILEKAKNSYRRLLLALQDMPQFSVWVVPVETAHGIKFSHMSDAYKVRVPGENILSRCSYDEDTEIITLENGHKFYKEDDTELQEIECGSADFDHIAWYSRIKDAEGKYFPFIPYDCEQPALLIVRFFVEKALNHYQSDSWFWRKWLDSVGFKSSTLESLEKAINGLKMENVIKDKGDDIVCYHIKD